jgi:hypothetical protein
MPSFEQVRDAKQGSAPPCPVNCDGYNMVNA